MLGLIHWIKLRLKIEDPKNQLAFLLGAITRPAILISAIIYFIGRLGSVSAIGVISVGKFLDNELIISEVFLLGIGLYMVLATRQITAASIAHLTQTIFRFGDKSRDTLQPFFDYLFIILGSIVLALYAGFDGRTFLVLSGTIGIGLGIGLQQPFLNLVTRKWLLLDGSIKPGEVLMINNEPCRVKNMGLRAITLRRQRDDAELLIPNQTLFQTKTEVFTAGENDRRETIVV